MIQASTASKTLIDNVKTSPRTVQNEAYQAGRLTKTLFDYAITLPGLLFIAPLFIVLSLLVKFNSPGPIFYRRRVVGQNGRIFYAFKFRTMFINGDEILANHPKLRAELSKNYKLKCDPRVTRVGQMLRKFSLDELPQLFNVLMRDMSLIGPRMITPEEVCKYGEYGEKLLTVMPGLSGLWQVSGRSDICYDERVQLDMQYIDNWSVAEDVKILFKTPLVVLKGDGAY